eukprot:TRINITY_DN10247_c0_g1_i3.p1 TRINITY_DN10247_c0_g1~~TRINITY_DN10247_c0_g1_i3.p1  ORF type:complete len:726 (-),score=42.15 TRINITY_DN10247_c0_g1_i3:283-2460(-)
MLSFKQIRFFSILLLFCLLEVRCSQEKNEHRVSWFVQLSDIHISRWYMNPIDPRELELEHLFKNVLSATKPAAVVITGDLTDGKTHYGQGRQQIIEWRAYQRVTSMISNLTNIERVFDVRGNHDTFDSGFKGHQNDYYLHFGGRREGVYQEQMLYLDEVYAQIGEHVQGCPDTVMMGLDITPNPGFRGPTNFAGILNGEMIQQLDRKFSEYLSKYRSCIVQPQIVVYGHHPLCVLSYTDVPLWKQALNIQQVDTKLEDIFLKYNVSAYINGHLHTKFGDRLHRMIPKSQPSQGYLAELQAGDWKWSRRFRIIATDKGQISFADYSYDAHNQQICTVENEHSLVKNFMIIITNPVDGRYHPLVNNRLEDNIASQQHDQENVEDPVANNKLRALVFNTSQYKDKFSVQGKLLCTNTNSNNSYSYTVRMLQVGDENSPLFEGAFPQHNECGNVANVTVIVRTRDGTIDSYNSIPIKVVEEGNNNDNSETQYHLPLQQEIIESIALWLHWPSVAFQLFYGFWSVVFIGMLIVPYIVAQYTGFMPQYLYMWKNGNVWIGALYPFYVLCEFAFQKPLCWKLYLIYILYLGMGPWYIIKLASDLAYGLGFPFGVILNMKYYPTPELYIVSSMQLAFVIIPLTLWLACVYSWCRRSQCNVKNKRINFIAGLLFIMALGSFVFYLQYKVLLQISVWYGIWTALFSPGIGGVVPVLLVVLGLIGYNEKYRCSKYE